MDLPHGVRRTRLSIVAAKLIVSALAAESLPRYVTLEACPC